MSSSVLFSDNFHFSSGNSIDLSPCRDKYYLLIQMLSLVAPAAPYTNNQRGAENQTLFISVLKFNTKITLEETEGNGKRKS